MSSFYECSDFIFPQVCSVKPTHKDSCLKGYFILIENRHDKQKKDRKEQKKILSFPTRLQNLKSLNFKHKDSYSIKNVFTIMEHTPPKKFTNLSNRTENCNFVMLIVSSSGLGFDHLKFEQFGNALIWGSIVKN